MGGNCCCKDRHPERPSIKARDGDGQDLPEAATQDSKKAKGRNPEGRKAVGVGVQKRKAPQPPPPPKTAAEDELIGIALKRNQFIKAITHLDRARTKQLVKVARKEVVEEGRVLIQEGDLNGDSFYIVAQGQFKMTSSGKNQVRARMTSADSRHFSEDVDGDGEPDGMIIGPAASFGELALLYLEPRSATVTALENSEVWVIDRQDFKDILMKVPEEKIEEYMKHLKEVESLKCLVDEERRALAHELVDLRFREGEEILEQGAFGNTFYILYDGEVAILKDQAVVNTLSASIELGRNHYFGEAALLESEVRCATVKVVSGEAHALAIDRETFDRVLRPLQDIIDLSRKEGAGRKAALHGKDEVEVAPSASQRPADREKIPQTDLITLGFLGRGGFGFVELVEHKPTGETYALKALDKGFIAQKGMQQNVMHEKNVQIILKSPFIVKLFETYSDRQRLFFLLEPALGGELYKIYTKNDLYGSARHAQYYTAGIVMAFEYLHSLSIVYRDLKPENMLLTDKGYVKLTDMGLAKVIKGRTFTACGTPDYFAPEIVKQTGHGMAVDWWELGVLIFEFMGGYPPFVANDPTETFNKICCGIDRINFPPPCKGVVEDLIKQLCKRSAAERLPMRAGGTKNIRQHPWFKSTNFDWEAFHDQKLPPPFKPAVNGPKDLSNFPSPPAEDRLQAQHTDDGSGWDADFATA